MKRIVAVLVLSLALSSFLSACDDDDDKPKTNTIVSADLSDRENAILTTTSDESYIFDYSNDKEYSEIDIWIEKYEQGELVNDQLTVLSSEITDEGTIIFTSQKGSGESHHPTFSIGISNNGATGSTMISDSTFISDSDIDLETIGMASTQENEVSLDDGETVLAGLIYSENGPSSIRTSFYNDESELKKYDIVYLFKVEFID